MKKSTNKLLLLFSFLCIGLYIKSQSIESISFSAVASSNDNFQPVVGSSLSGYISNASGSLTIASEYGKNDFKTTSGIASVGSNSLEVNIYPNPTDNFIIIEDFSINSNQENTVTITDNNGRVILFIKNYIDKTPINLNAFQSGVYFISLAINNESITSRKIIKSK
jgi:hypothetical protein